MAGVTDLVMVRFASKPYGFMRVAHFTMVPWLELKKIEYTRKGQRIFFELPEELTRYTVFDEAVAREMRPVATELKRRLSALSWTRMKRFHTRLSYQELENLASIGVAISL